MANDHPFQLLFETFGRLPASHAEAVNRKACEELTSVLQISVDDPGRCILLRAPRAGHGKTHLLSRVQHHLGGSHEFIPLHASGSRVDALSVTEDALNRLTRALPAAGGLTVLDLVARRLFAFALQPLVISGEVPCQDREGALAALKSRPVETFDFHHPNAVTAHWAKENFEVLGPRLSMELAQRCGVPVREVSFWVNAFFRFAATPVDHPGRAGALGLEVAGEPVTDGVAMERLTSLLALLSMLMRVVLVADDLEGFSADETAALKFAAFIGAIRQGAERADVVISLNQDVWENAFVPRLSGGLADRLSEVLIELEPLTEEEIVALFDSRAPGLGAQVLERVDVSERHARGLIRAAGVAWVKAAHEKAGAAPAAVAEPEPEPEPVAKMEAALEVEAARDLVGNAPLEEIAPPSPPEPIFEQTFNPPPAAEPIFEPVFNPPARNAFEPSPPSFFTPVFDEPAGSPAVQAFEPAESFPPSPPQWGSGSIFEAKVTDEPVKPEPFSQAHEPAFQAPPSFFQPVAPDEPVPPPVAYGSPAFQPVPPEAAHFGPPAHTPPQDLPQQAVEEDDRVDDLLKQFRERYGR